MGGIWLTRGELRASSGEITGQKSGLALSEDRAGDFLGAHYADVWQGDGDDLIRVRAEDFEQIIAILLFAVGNIPRPTTDPVGIRLFHKYRKDKKKRAIFEAVFGEFPEALRLAMEVAKASGTKSISLGPFFVAAGRTHGVAGLKIAMELAQDMALQQHRSPWSNVRRMEWKDVSDLADLFESESLETPHGSFFDQRFIDYLDRNFSDISSINWRKFEGLVCEFFERQGMYVEIGPGRDDGGIDARIWPHRDAKDLPPLTIVQCKRQKQKVSKVVIKALWADVISEGAASGLIVTTSSLSPGARRVSRARG